MRTRRGRRFLPLVLMSVALGAGVVPAGAQSPSEVFRKVRFDQKLNAQLPLDLEFRDETGRQVRLREYFAKKPVILALVYYECPMLCTLVLNELVKGLKPVSFTTGNEFDVVVVSFDPGETPALATEKKQAYLEEYGRSGAAGGWHFLTGNEDSIRALTETVGFHYLYDPQTDQYAHASGLIVLTPEGKVYRYFYGIEYAPRDLRLALVEASANKIGTPVDQMLLYCFHYDPKTGKYGVLIMNVMRLAGLGTLLALVAYMVMMFRRDRRPQPIVASTVGHQDSKI